MPRTDETRVDLLLLPAEVQQLDAIKGARGLRGRNAVLRALIREEAAREHARHQRREARTAPATQEDDR